MKPLEALPQRGDEILFSTFITGDGANEMITTLSFGDEFHKIDLKWA